MMTLEVGRDSRGHLGLKRFGKISGQLEDFLLGYGI